MRRLCLLTIWTLLGGPVLTVSLSRAQQLSCPTMPDITQVNHDVRSEVQVGVGSLGKLKAGEVGVKTDVVAKNLFDKYPNTDRIAVVQMMAATYCSMIRDSKTMKDSEKLRLWSEFTERVFKFANPSYVPAAPPAPRPKGNLTPGDKGKQAPAEPSKSGKTAELNTGKEKPAPAALQNPAAQHWFTISKDSPPEQIEFRASKVSIPLTLVTGNYFGDDLPVKVAPYYISTSYIPKQLFREHARNSEVRTAAPPPSEDQEPLCEIYPDDAKALAHDFGFQLPTEKQWVNAFLGKFIYLQGKAELVYEGAGKDEYLVEASTNDDWIPRSSYSYQIHMNSPGHTAAHGCLRIAISVDELRKIGFLKAP